MKNYSLLYNIGLRKRNILKQVTQVLDTSVVISLFKAFWYGTKARFLGSKLGGVFTHYRLTADKNISCEAPNKLIRDG